MLEDVQRYFAENHASTIAEAGEGNAERATTLLKELMVQYIVKRKYAIEGLTTEEPVSYTHLDVYKRQEYHILHRRHIQDAYAVRDVPGHPAGDALLHHH